MAEVIGISLSTNVIVWFLLDTKDGSWLSYGVVWSLAECIAVCEKCVHINVYLCSHREHIMTSFDHQNDRLQSVWEFDRGHVGVDLQLVYRISCR